MDIQSKIISNYQDQCIKYNKYLTRQEYRNLKPRYTSYLVEKIFGSWTKFIHGAKASFKIKRTEITKVFSKDSERIVLTFVTTGKDLDIKALNILHNFCKLNKCEFGIIWGVGDKTTDTFTDKEYDLIKDYLATTFLFEKDETCVAKDFLIKNNRKNPLLNIDKFNTKYKTLLLGSAKQYLRMLPYKNYDIPRLAYTTGTISNNEYKKDINGLLNNKNDTTGALYLEYDYTKKRYIVRNLIIRNDELHDLYKCYNENSVKNITPDAMILGDLHFPEEDLEAIKKTKQLLTELCPKYAVLHDVASWNSVSHHDENKYLTKVKNQSQDNLTLETELTAVINKLNNLVNEYPNINFKIVPSNHDDFISKWLDKGEFIKDRLNARLGAKLFIDYLDEKNILTDYLPLNVSYLSSKESFNINGFELSEHGDKGISGASGSINSFNRGFDKVICGHTHSPEIFETTVIVGTLSKLKLSYNEKGLTKWAHANAIIHNNGTFQLLFV